MTTAQRWHITGQYFENCNCDVLCPCIYSNYQATPTHGHCDAILAFNIDEGNYGDVSLDGLSFVMALQTPGPMGEGNAKLAVYVDETAESQQRESMGIILGGQAGGMPAMLPDMIPISEMLRITFAPISFNAEGNDRHVEIPGVMDVNVAGLEGAPGQIVHLDNVLHPANTRLGVARGTNSTYKDHDFDWDNSGKNGHFAPFEWSGP